MRYEKSFRTHFGASARTLTSGTTLSQAGSFASTKLLRNRKARKVPRVRVTFVVDAEIDDDQDLMSDIQTAIEETVEDVSPTANSVVADIADLVPV